MKTLEVLAAIGLVNLALVMGLVAFFDAASPARVPAVSSALPPQAAVTAAPVPEPSAPVPNGIAVPPATQPTPAVPPPAPTVSPPDTRCIVTVEGNRYDVTEFRASHPGGDIFVCGTDMTATFFGQHDRSVLQNLQQFRVQ